MTHAYFRVEMTVMVEMIEARPAEVYSCALTHTQAYVNFYKT